MLQHHVIEIKINSVNQIDDIVATNRSVNQIVVRTFLWLHRVRRVLWGLT